MSPLSRLRLQSKLPSRRASFLFMIMLLCTAIALVALVLLMPVDLKEESEAIDVGMTRQDVLKLLKRPPGTYAKRNLTALTTGNPDPVEYQNPHDLDETIMEWIHDEGIIRVFLGKEGRVVFVEFVPALDFEDRPYDFEMKHRIAKWRLRLLPR